MIGKYFHIAWHPKLLALVLAGGVIAGCADNIVRGDSAEYFRHLFSRDLTVLYRHEIQQGNILKEEDVAKIKLGTPKTLVSFLLGEPLTPALFEKDRWDYVYFKGPIGIRTNIQSVTYFFHNDKLVRIGHKATNPS